MRVGPIYIEDDGGLTILTSDGLRRLTAQTLVDAIGVETLQGPPGLQGIPGPGLPAGGTAGQLAVKASGTDYDTGWADLPADAAAGTAALRTLGTGARQAAAGNDSRLSDARTPTDGSVTAAKVAAGLKPSGSAATTDEALRALGSARGTACAGDDARLTDTRTPADRSVTAAKVADALKPSGSAAATDEALRRIGTGAGEAAAGASALGVVVYAGSLGAARPTGYAQVAWVGFPSEPTNWQSGDALLRSA